MGDPGSIPGLGRSPGEGIDYPLQYLGFPGGSGGKESPHNAGDLGSIPDLERSPERRHGNPLQYSYLENPHGQRSQAGCGPWGRKKLDTTEQLSIAHTVLPGLTMQFLSCETIA